MAKMGRPPDAKGSIIKEEMEFLLGLYPTKEDLAEWFKVSMSTIERYLEDNYDETFDTLRDKKCQHIRIKIKKRQIEKALEGDNVMLIWVGKQLLGQVDKSQLDLNKVPDEQLMEVVRTRLIEPPK